jgi:hypothetical protein
MRASGGEKTTFAMHKRTFAGSGGRQPAVGVGNTFAQTQARLFGGLPTVRVRIAIAFPFSGAAKGRLLYQRRLSVIFSRCARVQCSHRGLTPPLLRSGNRFLAQADINPRLVSFPTGAYAPRSCVAVRMFGGEKRLLRCTNARRKRAAGVSPPWCSGNVPATPIPHTFGYTRLARKQERRVLARRGCEYRTCNGKRFRRERRSSLSGAAGVSPPWLP